MSNQLVEHFFRHESANLIVVLTRVFGFARIDLIEDMVQASLLEALNAWKQTGVPDNPAGWMHRVAKNRILDALRREKVNEKAVERFRQTNQTTEAAVDHWLEEEQLPDSLLRMMFVCCHPSLERKTQLALTLKTLCGFGVSEIARGLILPRETVKKRIQRAKASLAKQQLVLDLPTGGELERRLDVVHGCLYLMFNEGYSTSQGTEPIRDDICEEATRLCHILCHSNCGSPTTRALLALQLFHAARLESRQGTGGEVILLEDQDRHTWDQQLISVAHKYLAQSQVEVPTTFHLEAAIAMQHCIAPSIADTDWDAIVRFYDRLIQISSSPIYLLNRAIALGQAGDRRQAMDELSQLRSEGGLDNYMLLDCAVARIHQLNRDRDAAINAYLSALGKATAEHEKAFVKRKLSAL